MAFSHLGRALDVEWFLKRDQSRPPAELEHQDRLLTAGSSSLGAALDQWLEGRRQELHHLTVGSRVAEAFTWLHLLLVVLSLLAGSATAEALLLADPEHPTNVLTFLFATLVWPFALLTFSVLWLLLRRTLAPSPLVSELFSALVSLLERAKQRNEEHRAFAQEWRSLRRQHRRYRELELLAVASATQWYAASFHAAAGFSLLRSALFSNLTFAWSTTNRAVEGDTLATWFAVVTAPWCQTLGVGCVSAQLVRATEFVPFTGSYVSVDGPAMSGAWWLPLCLSLFVYGVGPRLAVAVYFSRRLTRLDAALGDSHIELRRRLMRGLSLATTRRGHGPDAAPTAPPRVAAPRAAATSSAADCWFIAWRGAQLDPDQAEQLAAERGYRIQRSATAGGADYALDETLLGDLSRAAHEPVLLLVEGWEAPDKATRRFIAQLRACGAEVRPIHVLVHSAAPNAELEIWRDRLAFLQDPFVSVEHHPYIAAPAAVQHGAHHP